MIEYAPKKDSKKESLMLFTAPGQCLHLRLPLIDLWTLVVV